MILLALLLAFIGVLYAAHKWNFTYWKRKGVPGPNPKPIVGNMWECFVVSKPLGQIYAKMYNDFSHAPYIGFYKFMTPSLMIRDPVLVKTVFAKEFESFHDNEFILDEKVDPLMSRNPFFQKGHKWKIIRGQVSPSFSSGKTKLVLPLILEVTQDMMAYVKQESKVSNILEAKELSAKFTTDVVASCAFGLKAESFVNPNAMFRKMARKLFEPTTLNSIKFMMLTLFPKLGGIIKVGFTSNEVADWMRKVVRDTLKYREENGVVRDDFLQSMYQLTTKPGEHEFTYEDVTAQALSFVLDGSETSSTVICFALYEIAANSSVQKRLRDEITKVLSKHEGKLTYDSMRDMNYLDATVNETLRKYPPGDGLFRVCTKQFTFPPIDGGDGAGVTVEVGTPVAIPTYALHRDPEHFPNPDLFNPDRFLDEEQKQGIKNAFYPFGDGPRMCLGYRFALMQVKACIVSIVTNMELSVDSRTQEPLKMDPKSFLPLAIGGIWIKFDPIQS